MRKLLLALVGILVLGPFAAIADSPSNTHGMCTAYFNGSENGQAHKRQSNAFVQFASYVGNNDNVDNDGDDETDEGDEVATPTDIWNFCSDPANNPKGIGGQPDDPNTAGNGGNGKKGKGKG